MGLMVRMGKLMLSVLKLSGGEEHGETVVILSRCVFESSINLRYLLRKNSGQVYERFVKTGLKGERSLYDTINANIEKRGGSVLGIEARMLVSIERTCDGSGVDIEDVNPRAGGWGGSLKDKLKALEIDDDAYVIQSTGSESVHGNWSDLLRYHLSVEESGFAANLGHHGTDGKVLGPVALMALAAAREYLDESFDAEESERLRNRLDDLIERLWRVEDADPGWEASG